MNNYNYQKRKKKKEKTGFYVALSICIVAVGMAVWSTYSSVNDYIKKSDDGYKSTLTTAEAVHNTVTGVTLPEYTTEYKGFSTETQEATEEATQITEVTDNTFDSTMPSETMDALSAALKVGTSLGYPVKSKLVLNEYSEVAVYNETMKDYRAHTGVDFKGSKDDDVVAMSDGTVESIFEDTRLGKVIVVSTQDYSIYYCGMDKVQVEKGQTVSLGDKLGKIGKIPFESDDELHVHIEIKVNGQYIDPLAVISNNE